MTDWLKRYREIERRCLARDDGTERREAYERAVRRLGP